MSRAWSRRLCLVGMVAASALAAHTAFADCTNPASPEGGLDYDYFTHTYQYCDNTSTWQPLTAGAGGYADHIISGTTAVWVNSNTATISFTTNGSVANYLDSLGRLVTTGISVSTNQMSATTGYFSQKVGIGTSTPSSTLDVAGLGRFTSTTIAGPTAGSGVEIFYDGVANYGRLFAYDRSASAWRNMYLGPTNLLALNSGGTVGVGLLSQSPTATLQVSGTFAVSTSAQVTTPSLYVNGSGNVGIGTTSPVGYLNVADGATGGGVMMFARQANLNNGSRGSFIALGKAWSADNAAYVAYKPNATAASNQLSFGHYGADDLMVIQQNGNVGIANSAPIAKLDITGTVSASDAIQVSGSSLTCSSAINGAIRYQSTSGTIQVCQGSIWTSLISGTGAATVTGAGSATAVAFWSSATGLTYSGSLNFDATTGRLGVSTTSPQSTLHVAETGSTGLDWLTTIQNPNNSSGFGYGVGIKLKNSVYGGNESNKWAGIAAVGGTSYAGGSPVGYSNQTDLAFYTNYDDGSALTAGYERMRILGTSGRVGIGTQSPTAQLQVSGSLTVSTTGQTTTPSLYVSATGKVGIGTSTPEGALDLIVTMDDATSEILSLLLVAEEGTASTFQALREVVAEHGLFCALYTDRGSHYFETPQAGGKVSKTQLTQVGRALKQLGIEHIAAYSPEARGRSERLFRTLQDRLPKELRLAGIATIEAANAWLQRHYMAEHNRRFAVQPEEEGTAFVADSAGAWRNILCVIEERVVGNDNTVAWGGLKLQLPQSRLRPHFVRAKVQVRCYPDGEITIDLGPHRLARYGREGEFILATPTASSLAAGSAPSRRGLEAAEPASPSARRPASTAPRPAAHAKARVGTEKRASGRTKKPTGRKQAA